ncbi:hypothetical protein [Synechococcus elongatus]|uniref:hypothetical protein n=1 Tax=Synechococcus elongatus TaxID=32046 RepID=UPI000F7E8A04|nr:hypothetical protein [Synechococcus elongatus]
MAAATKRAEFRAQQVERELPPLPDNQLPTIRGLLVDVNVRETVVYVRIRYKDPSARGGASTLSLKCWDVSLGQQLAALPEHADIVCEFAPRNTQDGNGTWERWNYLSAVWV